MKRGTWQDLLESKNNSRKTKDTGFKLKSKQLNPNMTDGLMILSYGPKWKNRNASKLKLIQFKFLQLHSNALVNDLY